ncbi:MAG: radical SAM protein [bacterium]|nr:radical SAM protein [bacterium]
MDYAYRFASADRLYLNGTNRCSNRCDFCVRQHRPGLGDGRLWGGPEPDEAELFAAIDEQGGAGAFSEIVWCGFGEPTFRLDLIRAVSPVLQQGGARVRLDTNGHGCLIHGRDIINELAEVVDEVWVSLNAPDVSTYVNLCDPGHDMVNQAGDPPVPESFWDAMLDFLKRACQSFEVVGASVVGHTLEPGEIESSRDLAETLGCSRFRVR